MCNRYLLEFFPLVMTNIAMENGLLWLIYPVDMLIFHSYVNVYQRVVTTLRYTHGTIATVPGDAPPKKRTSIDYITLIQSSSDFPMVFMFLYTCKIDSHYIKAVLQESSDFPMIFVRFFCGTIALYPIETTEQCWGLPSTLGRNHRGWCIDGLLSVVICFTTKIGQPVILGNGYPLVMTK